MPFAIEWTEVGFEDAPAGTSAANALDTVIQTHKKAVRERLEIEHYMLNVDELDGIHKFPFLASAARDALTDKQGQIVLSSDAARISFRDDNSVWQEVEGLHIGDLKIAAYTTEPFGWKHCDGESLSKTGTFADLFAVIDYKYGGSGANFNLPDLSGHIPIGIDSGDSTFDTLGKQDGALTHTLDETEMPSHTHIFTGTPVSDHTHSYFNVVNDSGAPPIDFSTSEATRSADSSLTGPSGAHTPAGTNATAGSNAAHNNVQPSIVFQYFIRYL